MKKILVILTEAALMLSFSACRANPDRVNTAGDTSIGGLFWDILQGQRGDTEKPQAILINIENHTGSGIPDIAMSWSQDGIPLGSRGMEHANQSPISEGEIISFDFLPEDFALAELKNLRFDVYVGAAPHEDYTACGGFFLETAAYGEAYSFELRMEDGSYVLWQTFEDGTVAEMPLDVPAETVPDEPASTETDVPSFSFDPLDLTGPWHVDGTRNDCTELANRYEGYGEFGARMELRSNGQLSWYIGAEGGSGTYSIEGTALTAELTRPSDDSPMTTVFTVLRDGDELYLCMHGEQGDVFWCWGDDASTNLAGEDLYPGKDIVELINRRGDKTTAYKLADGRYMDRISAVYVFDGVETWTDENGVEWNETLG